MIYLLSKSGVFGTNIFFDYSYKAIKGADGSG
jgi:hypothetical protein